MKYIKLIILLILNLCSCQERTTNTHNINKTITTTAIVNPEEINLGAINSADSKDVSFTIKNTGDNNLIINDIITSCGCISVTHERHPAKPGESLSVTVKITPTEKGTLDKTLIIKCNTNNTLNIKIKGNIL